MTRSRQTADWGSRAGLAKIVPSSVAVGSGTGSASALGTVTFSGCSSVSLNDVFNSTYTNYKIVLTISNNATLGATYIRLRVGGTDNSSANYAAAGQGITDSSAARNTVQVLGTEGMKVGYAAASGIMHSDITMFNPFETAITSMYANTINSDTTTVSNTTVASRMSVTTSYTGFTIIPPGNITGTLSVYGYTN